MGQTIKNIVFYKEITRPSDTTAYTAEDSVNASGTTDCLTFSVSDGIDIVTGQSFQIKTARLVTNSTTITNGSFRLYLFDQSVSGFIDNSPQPLTYSDRAKRCGYIDFTLTTGGSGSDCSEAIVNDCNISIRTEATDIYGILIAKAAYPPASGQKFYIELNAFGIDL